MPADRISARAARPEDVEPLLRTLCAAFGIPVESARPLFHRDPFYDLSHKRILTNGAGEILSCLSIIPATLRLGAASVKLGGIAGVATHPDRQRRGYAGRLLAETINDIALECGCPVSALFPFSPAFYERYGWGTVSRSVRWADATSSLSNRPKSGGIARPVRDERDQEAIHRLHKANIDCSPFGLQRDRRRWTVIETMTPSRGIAVYEALGGLIEGYVFYEKKASGTLIIQELTGNTESSRSGLMAFLASLSSQFPFAVWDTTSDSLLSFGLVSSSHVSASPPRPEMMLRIVDLKPALACLHQGVFAPVLAQRGETLTVRTVDKVRPANQRPVRISSSCIAWGDIADPDWIQADIRTLSQIYAGTCTPSEAALQAGLTASSPSALACADVLFPSRSPFIPIADLF